MKSERWREKKRASVLPSLSSPALCLAASSLSSASASVDFPPFPAEPGGGRDSQCCQLTDGKRKASRDLRSVMCNRRTEVYINLQLHMNWARVTR